jgi:cytochrome P450
MDLFVREVLRMHPIAIQVVNRQCMENAHVDGYHIQEGSTLYFRLKTSISLSVFFN